MKNYTLDSQMENLIKYYNESITVLIYDAKSKEEYLVTEKLMELAPYECIFLQTFGGEKAFEFIGKEHCIVGIFVENKIIYWNAGILITYKQSFNGLINSDLIEILKKNSFSKYKGMEKGPKLFNNNSKIKMR